LPNVETEPIATFEALGRVTAQDILSPEDLPAFPRSTMDGYSVRAGDTFGASEGLPAYLEVVGEVSMGRASQISLAPGQAAGAYTGGMLAKGADAVVIVEHTQPADDNTIEVLRPVAPGENVVQPGEDVHQGDPVLPAGHLIRPQDIGGLLALGITQTEVGRRPRVSIVSTGDELVPPEGTPGPGQIRDINTYTISALVTQAGGNPVPIALVGDDFEAQRDTALRGLDQGDMLVFSAGSSVSSRDMTAAVIESLGSPGVLAHGISLKPGKPTIVGMVNGKPALGLPGNPVSAMVVFELLVRPAIYLLSGCARPPATNTVQARLARDIPSQSGREDYVQVRLAYQNGTLSAEPVFGKSNLIYTLIRADGTVKVPLDKGGLYGGEEVSVRLY
jgi:molybdopterin molybdotransferase